MAADLLATPNNQDLIEYKQGLFENLRLRMGGDIVDLELDPQHYEAAYNYAIKLYRQRAQNANIESYTLFTVQKNVYEYTLPSEFINVRYTGGLATYDFYAGYVELTARMFGGYLTYTFNPVSKLLKVTRDFKGTGERILIWADVQRPELELLQDPGAGVWIGDYILAVLKGIIGEAREKFQSIAGPGGGTSLNGAAMKAESKADQERLIMELKAYVDYSQPLTWVQG